MSSNNLAISWHLLGDFGNWLVIERIANGTLGGAKGALKAQKEG